MAEALRSPPRGFETLVREHFWRKKWYILDVVAGWLREAKRPGGVQGHYRGTPGCLPPWRVWRVAILSVIFRAEATLFLGAVRLGVGALVVDGRTGGGGGC